MSSFFTIEPDGPERSMLTHSQIFSIDSDGTGVPAESTVPCIESRATGSGIAGNVRLDAVACSLGHVYAVRRRGIRDSSGSAHLTCSPGAFRPLSSRLLCASRASEMQGREGSAFVCLRAVGSLWRKVRVSSSPASR